MKILLFILALLLALPSTAQTRRTTTRRSATATRKTNTGLDKEGYRVVGSYEGIFSDDVMAGLGSLSDIYGIGKEANPLAHLKGKRVTVTISFNVKTVSPKITISESKEKIIELSFGGVLQWDEGNRLLYVEEDGYIFEVITEGDPHIVLLKTIKGTDSLGHMWSINPIHKTRNWFDMVLQYAHIGMSGLKIMEEPLSSHKWENILNSFERAFPKAKEYLNELEPLNAKNNKSSAEKQKQPAVNREFNSMFQKGKNYHEGNGLAKDEQKAYKWLIKAYLQGNETSKQTVMEYIMKNLERRRTFPCLLTDSHPLVTDQLDPLTLYQHPLATIPTGMVFDNGKKITKYIKSRRNWDFQEDKRSITIYAGENMLPSLYGEHPFTINWHSFSKKVASFDFSFHFNSYELAEDFAFQYAHDLFCNGLDFKLFAKREKNTFSLRASAPFTLEGREYSFHNTIFVNSISSDKELIYCASIEFTLIRK